MAEETESKRPEAGYKIAMAVNDVVIRPSYGRVLRFTKVSEMTLRHHCQKYSLFHDLHGIDTGDLLGSTWTRMVEP